MNVEYLDYKNVMGLIVYKDRCIFVDKGVPSEDFLGYYLTKYIMILRYIYNRSYVINSPMYSDVNTMFNEIVTELKASRISENNRWKNKNKLISKYY